MQVFENSSLEVSEESEIVATQAPEVDPDRKVRFILGELFEVDNPMTGSDFDWMVSNQAVWGWKVQ